MGDMGGRRSEAVEPDDRTVFGELTGQNTRRPRRCIDAGVEDDELGPPPMRARRVAAEDTDGVEATAPTQVTESDTVAPETLEPRPEPQRNSTKVVGFAEIGLGLIGLFAASFWIVNVLVLRIIDEKSPDPIGTTVIKVLIGLVVAVAWFLLTRHGNTQTR